jgi:hypothetical protein
MDIIPEIKENDLNVYCEKCGKELNKRVEQTNVGTYEAFIEDCSFCSSQTNTHDLDIYYEYDR